MILGHTHDLEYFSNVKIRDPIIASSIERKINLFSFEDEGFTSEVHALFKDKGINLYYPELSVDNIPEKMGKMYTIKTPVLGVFGTSKQQGKFTLQLQLRERFLRDRYKIGQLGSEPESLLFGMDYVYPFGYRGIADSSSLRTIEYLNY
ncbi:hypothetical protein FACS189461_4090 [Spirochaetia bacterium]|nr:hypothetical protein FACS189461_4090 [Spirochaetia bacterium]